MSLTFQLEQSDKPSLHLTPHADHISNHVTVFNIAMLIPLFTAYQLGLASTWLGCMTAKLEGYQHRLLHPADVQHDGPLCVPHDGAWVSVLQLLNVWHILRPVLAGGTIQLYSPCETPQYADGEILLRSWSAWPIFTLVSIPQCWSITAASVLYNILRPHALLFPASHRFHPQTCLNFPRPSPPLKSKFHFNLATPASLFETFFDLALFFHHGSP